MEGVTRLVERPVVSRQRLGAGTAFAHACRREVGIEAKRAGLGDWLFTTSVQLKIATRVHSKTRETWPVSEVIIVIFIKFRFINITGAPSHFAVT